MESKTNNSISIDIPNYSGPLETLLDLAKSQKVDLTKISITMLADQFVDFIKNFKDKNLDLAFEYLLMATWLTYLKSRLLLPEDQEDDFKASEVANKLKLQLKKLELIRLLSDELLKRKRIGRDIFYRGTKGGIRSIKNPVYKNRVIFDGYPRSLSQAKNLEKLLHQSNRKIDLIFFLNVNKETIIERIEKRKIEENRSDDEFDTILKRYDVYMETTKPVLNFYSKNSNFHEIDGSQKIDEITSKIDTFIKV